MSTLQQSKNKNPKSQKLWGWVSKTSWVLFLKGTISFQGFGWKVELHYQPFLEDRIIANLVQNLNPTNKAHNQSNK